MGPDRPPPLICTNCGNDDAAEGFSWCTDCLMTEADPYDGDGQPWMDEQ